MCRGVRAPSCRGNTGRGEGPLPASGTPEAPPLSESPQCRILPGPVVTSGTTRPAHIGPRRRALQFLRRFHPPGLRTASGPVFILDQLSLHSSEKSHCPSCRALVRMPQHGWPRGSRLRSLPGPVPSPPTAAPGHLLRDWQEDHLRLRELLSLCWPHGDVRARQGARSRPGAKRRAVCSPQPEPPKQHLGVTAGAHGERSGGRQPTAHRHSLGLLVLSAPTFK